MAVQNDSRLYSGGSAVVNTQPVVNMYAQLMLRKKAKEEALDEYDKQRMNHINDTGLRDVDRQGLDQRILDIQTYYNQNKDKIRKGNTPESYEYEKLFRNTTGFINQSKERTAKQDAAMKFYQEKLKQDGRIPDDFMRDLESNDKGIDDFDIDPNAPEQNSPAKSRTFDLKKWLDIPKPFNQQTFIKGMADIKRTPTQTRYEAVQGDPLKQNEITEEVFDKDAKGVIAFRAADKFQNSYSFAETVKEEIKDPNNRKELADLFVQEYGTAPISGEDYATAYSLKLLQPKITKTKAVDNKSAVMDRTEAFRKKMFDLAESGRNSRASMNRQQTGLANYDIFGNYEPDMKPMTVKVPNPNGWGTVEEEVVTIPFNSIDPKDKKLIGDVRPYTNAAGEKYFVVRTNGNWEGNGGQVISRVNVAKSNMDQTTANEVGRGRLDKNIVPQNPDVRTPKDIKTTKMTYRVGGKEFSKEQIEKGAKKNKMTVDQYLKAIGAN